MRLRCVIRSTGSLVCAACRINLSLHLTFSPFFLNAPNFQLLHAAGSGRYQAVTPQTSDRNAPVSVLATTVSKEVRRSDDSSQPCSTAGSSLNLALYIASWHRVDAERFSCNAATKTCDVDPHGTFTDHSLCDANCNQGLGARQAPQPTVSTLQIKITHNSTAKIPASGRGCRMDDTHANPAGAWQKMGSPAYPTPEQIATLDTASQLVEEVVVCPGLPIPPADCGREFQIVSLTRNHFLFAVSFGAGHQADQPYGIPCYGATGGRFSNVHCVVRQHL